MTHITNYPPTQPHNLLFAFAECKFSRCCAWHTTYGTGPLWKIIQLRTTSNAANKPIEIKCLTKSSLSSIIDEFLHSDIASRQDNYRKRKVVLQLPALEDGKMQYCVHWQRELRSNWKTLFVLLTDKDNRGEPVAGWDGTVNLLETGDTTDWL